MTLSLARALAPKIRVNAICPGFIDTRWFRAPTMRRRAQKIRDNVAATTPLQVVSTPEDIADAALFLISDASRRITGEITADRCGPAPGCAAAAGAVGVVPRRSAFGMHGLRPSPQ